MENTFQNRNLIELFNLFMESKQQFRETSHNNNVKNKKEKVVN